MKRLFALFIFLLTCSFLLAQQGYIAPSQWVGISPSGQIMYVSVDSTGALEAAGLGGSQAAPNQYYTPVMPYEIGRASCRERV